MQLMPTPGVVALHLLRFGNGYECQLPFTVAHPLGHHASIAVPRRNAGMDTARRIERPGLVRGLTHDQPSRTSEVCRLCAAGCPVPGKHPHPHVWDEV